MKTKKEILKWWEERGKITGNDYIDDYKDFLKKIDKGLEIHEQIINKGQDQEIEIILNSSRWKFPLILYFYNFECYKITNF